VTTEAADTLGGAQEYCRQVAMDHYENFPIASFFIPKKNRKHFYAAYAFMRMADDLADNEGLEITIRLQLLLQWQAKLDACYEGRAEEPVFLALQESVRELDIPKIFFDDLLNAFKIDLFKNRYRTFDELQDYCRYSANPVGRLVLYILGYAKHAAATEILEASDQICTALQLANHWQDVFLDQKKDRLYIPLCDLENHNYTLSDWRSGRTGEGFQELLRFQVARTKEFFRRGQRVFSYLKFPERYEIGLVWLSGWRILEKIERRNYDVLHHRPTITIFDKSTLLIDLLLSRHEH
jgi:squalene synthase HpnC